MPTGLAGHITHRTGRIDCPVCRKRTFLFITYPVPIDNCPAYTMSFCSEMCAREYVNYLLGIANDEREKAASLHTSINKVSPFTQPKV